MTRASTIRGGWAIGAAGFVVAGLAVGASGCSVLLGDDLTFVDDAGAVDAGVDAAEAGPDDGGPPPDADAGPGDAGHGDAGDPDAAAPECDGPEDCGTRARATATCVLGRCVFRCDDGYGDCDGSPDNGCEADLHTARNHCGACPTACAAPENASVECVGGRCISTCRAGFLECDLRI